MMKAQIQMELKDTTQAEVLVDSALSADKYNVPSLSLKASLLMNREEWKEAETTLAEAIRLRRKMAA